MNADLSAVKSLVSGFAFNPEGALMWTPPGATAPEPLAERPIGEVRGALIAASQATQAVVAGQSLPYSLEAADAGVKRPWQIGHCDNGNLFAFEAPVGAELATVDMPEYGLTKVQCPAKSEGTRITSIPIAIQEGLMASVVVMVAAVPSNLTVVQTTLLLGANAYTSSYIIVIPQSELVHFWQLLPDLQDVAGVQIVNQNGFVSVVGGSVSIPQEMNHFATPEPLVQLFRAVAARIAEEQRGA